MEGKQGRKGNTGPPGPRGDAGDQGHKVYYYTNVLSVNCSYVCTIR